MILQLPFTSDPAQIVTVQLNKVKYRMEVQYNERSEVWTLSIYRASDNAPLALGLALVLDVDVLDPLNLNMGSIVAMDVTEAGTEAGPDDFGDRVKVYWFSEDERPE